METPTEEAAGEPSYDHRRPEDVRYDAIADQIRDTTALVRQMAETVREFTEGGKGITQRVIYKTEGMGSVGVICASICALCVVFVVVLTIILSGAMRDLWAWKDIHSNDIAALKADVKQIKERK